MEGEVILGVCCSYCRHFDRTACPVSSASPWSRFKNFCSEYTPDPNNDAALTMGEGLAETAMKKQEMKPNG